MNISIREKKTKKGIHLYLDKNTKSKRYEFLKLYLFDPQVKGQKLTIAEKEHNRKTKIEAEGIKADRNRDHERGNPIICLMFCFLTIQPLFNSLQTNVCTDQDCCTEKSCTKDKGCEKKPNKNNCDSNNCNPFSACVCGNCYIVEIPFLVTDINVGIRAKIIAQNDNIIMTNLAECWHPPEIM